VESGIGLLPTNARLGSKRDAEQIQCALLNHGWLSKHIEDGEALVCWLNSVFDDRCQIADERLEAVNFGAVGGLFGKGLEFGGGGALAGATMEVRVACACGLSSSSKRMGAKSWRICHST